jgi:hypothetical protein
MDINLLTTEEKAAIKAQLEAEATAERERIDSERKNYKQLVNTTVAEQIVKLQNASSTLSKLKADVYGAFSTLIELKNELYNSKKSNQMSHTFTDAQGSTITIGFRTVDKFDDTLDMGIAKIGKYIDSLNTDEKSAKLVSMINNLLKKDTKGNLKPNRILDLENLANNLNDPLFTEGVAIIRESYKPDRSSIFIEAEMSGLLGKKINVPLSITLVDFPEGFKANLEVFK